MLLDRAALAAFLRNLLASGLCLLALVFAFEAKTAWYGPAVGPATAISAAKAMPADWQNEVSHGIPVPDPVHPALPFLIFAALIIAFPAGFDIGVASKSDRGRVPRGEVQRLSPHLFFRPPPII